MKDEVTKGRFMELRASGWSFARISEELKTSKPILIKWSRDLQIEIRNLRKIELEALHERCVLSHENRLSMFGAALKKASEELAKRDYRELPTDKLLDTVLKLSNTVKNEQSVVSFETQEFSLDFPARSWEA